MIKGFRTPHFLTFAKHFPSNICKTKQCLLGCTLFSVISNFEVENELWQPYLSLCYKTLAHYLPVSAFEPVVQPKLRPFVKSIKAEPMSSRKMLIYDKSLKFEPETRLRPS